MPWELKRHEDGRVCVHRKGEADPLHCYTGDDAEAQAKKYLAALYANEPDAKALPEVLVSSGGAVKALGGGKLRGPLVPFGGLVEFGDNDIEGEYFDGETDYSLDFPARVGLFYHHGIDPELGKQRLAKADLSVDREAVWFESQLDLSNRYHQMIYRLAEQGRLGASSGAAAHLVSRRHTAKGIYIETWPLAEASVTVAPINPLTVGRVQAVKALAAPEWGLEEALGDLETAEALKASTALPIAPRDRPWDSDAAEGRVRTWAGANEEPNAKYGQAFLRVDGGGSKFGDYHLPCCDVIDGKLTIIPRAVFAVAAALSGSRGASPAGAETVKPKVGALYARLAAEFNDPSFKPPWEAAGKALDLPDWAEQVLACLQAQHSPEEWEGLKATFDTAASQLTQYDRLRGDGKDTPKLVIPRFAPHDLFPAGLPLEEKSERLAALTADLTAAARDYQRLVRDKAAFRVKAGRMLSQANRDRLAAAHTALGDAHGALGGVHTDLGQFLAECDDGRTTDEAPAAPAETKAELDNTPPGAPGPVVDPVTEYLREFGRFQTTLARLRGVPV